jgi:Mg2+ and Co2+ transporter CorA
MNVDLPFHGYAHAFTIVIVIAIVISMAFGIVFWRKKYF